MPLPVISNVYRVAMIWQDTGGLRAQTVMHFRRSSSTAQAVATAFDANVTANMWISLKSSTKVTELHVTPLDGSSATLIMPVTGAKWAGVGTSGDIIPAAAVVVSFRTALRGKSNRGRIYLPFVAEAALSSGTLVSTDVTAGQTAWTNFIAAMNTATTPPVVASYKNSTWVDVVTAIYESVAGTQRRRQSRLRS